MGKWFANSLQVLAGVAAIISAIFAVIAYFSPPTHTTNFFQSVVVTIKQLFTGQGSSNGGATTETGTYVGMSTTSQDRFVSMALETPARLSDAAGRRISMNFRVAVEGDEKLLFLLRAGLTAQGWSVSTENGSACDLHFNNIRGINIYMPPQVPDKLNELQRVAPGDRMNISMAAVCPARLHPDERLLISATIFGFPAGAQAGRAQPSVYSFSGYVTLAQ